MHIVTVTIFISLKNCIVWNILQISPCVQPVTKALLECFLFSEAWTEKLKAKLVSVKFDAYSPLKQNYCYAVNKSFIGLYVYFFRFKTALSFSTLVNLKLHSCLNTDFDKPKRHIWGRKVCPLLLVLQLWLQGLEGPLYPRWSARLSHL